MTTVQTVRGPVAADDLGITLTHEHLLNDVSSWWQRSGSHGLDPDEFADAPVSEALLWDLRQDPFGNRANLALDDIDVACAELGRFAALGGRTVVEATGWGIGRDLAGLRRISERTGVHVVAGTGFYLEASHPVDVVALGPDGVTDRILADVRDGEDGVRPGIIGEIGVSAEFSAAEQVSLRGALAAQVECGLPIQIHLPGWFRLAGTVLDLAESVGADLSKLVLCHMGPSGEDRDYQRAAMDRGAWVQYDMLGMEVYYADQGVQCPSDEQNAAHLAHLVERGYGGRLLLSQDVFVKSLLRRHGGPGYAHILQYFAPRLRRHGVHEEQVLSLMTDNPRRLFGGQGQPTEGTP
ncbi:phosphotriesterase [Blastococcus sp. CT_GayMR19]|uniref:phosphotriesterase family protein n=1 Tax=Blastococcus sp. CT_GayMR19 TaxID=2559608 RepID=UPI001073D911|nr:phosphotriesterase [Blastococcus sp. CT_GayMR19]TFV71051.1 phosphotriesterase [Blastococcus sp. CT_GayMR19]